MSTGVEREVSRLKYLIRGERPTPPDEFPQPRKQLESRKWLDEEIIAARFQRGSNFQDAVAGGKHQDRSGII